MLDLWVGEAHSVSLFAKLVGKMLGGGKKGKPVSVSVSASTFVPKPFTPFQFEPQLAFEEIPAKQQHLLQSIKTKKIVDVVVIIV